MRAQDGASASFAGLIAPLSMAEFRTLLRTRTPCHVNGPAADRYAGLASWNGLMDALQSGVIPVRKLRLSQGSKILPAAFYRDANGLRATSLEAVMRSGGSAIV
ncbi:hypothetical protein DBR17_03525, partial [Sphingomonas sp. HMWF008]